MGMAAVDPQFHVLAVDDSLIDRKLIERLLKTSSYQVTTVDSGSKALEFLGWHEYERSSSKETSVSSKNQQQEMGINLVITDYCMPGMTGYDLLKKMKESSSLKDIPVVIMSSENVPSRINRCLEEGAEEFFLKPVRLSDVSKLRPHMMKKTKCKENQNEEEEEPEKQENINKEESTSTSPSSSLSSELQTTQSQQQQQEETAQSSGGANNKRKSLEEGLSPDRTRPRYSDLTVTSN